MSAVDEIKARLSAAGTPFAMVKGAASLAQVKDRPDNVPAAFVLVAREVSAENERATGRVLQRCERDIMVVIVATNLSDADGEAAADEVEQLKEWVRAQLLGWTAASIPEPITHVAGEIVQAVAGTAWFEDTFAAPYYLKETA